MEGTSLAVSDPHDVPMCAAYRCSSDNTGNLHEYMIRIVFELYKMYSW